jgi:hypothetical protein
MYRHRSRVRLAADDCARLIEEKGRLIFRHRDSHERVLPVFIRQVHFESVFNRKSLKSSKLPGIQISRSQQTGAVGKAFRSLVILAFRFRHHGTDDLRRGRWRDSVLVGACQFSEEREYAEHDRNGRSKLIEARSVESCSSPYNLASQQKSVITGIDLPKWN